MGNNINKNKLKPFKDTEIPFRSHFVFLLFHRQDKYEYLYNHIVTFSSFAIGNISMQCKIKTLKNAEWRLVKSVH